MKNDKYTMGQDAKKLQEELEAHKGRKPGEYQSPWEESIKGLLNQIQNRKPFSYHPGNDPLYRQAVDRYVRLGREAMMDTMGQAAALTGGYGNSYAQSAGQQAYQKYLLGLSSRLGQFQQMAMDRHQAEGQDLLNRYQALQQQEKAGYDRYQTAVNQYLSQLDRLQGAFDAQQDRDYQAFIADRDFNYGKEKDALEAARKAAAAQREQERFQMQQAYQQERDKIRDQQWKQDFEESQRRIALELQLRQMEAAARAAARRPSGSSRSPKRQEAEEKPRRPMNRFYRGEYHGPIPTRNPYDK